MKYLSDDGLGILCREIKNDTIQKSEATTADTAEIITATTSDILSVSSAKNITKSVAANTNVNVWTSQSNHSGYNLVNVTLTFPNTGGSVRSVRINGTEYARVYPSGTGATIVTITKLIQLDTPAKILINATHNANAAMTVTLNNIDIIKL